MNKAFQPISNKKVAVVDLGTNTFQFCLANIANNNFEIIFEKSLAPKIGLGGISNGIITVEAINRAINCLQKFTKIAFTYGILPNEILAFGTSAIRNANNSNHFCEEILDKTGIVIQVISGEKEAELIANGVRFAIEFEQEPYLIMDIGGGSVEFIIANKSTVFWKQSFEIGGQRLMDLYFKTDPISPNQISKMNSFFDEKLIGLSNAIHQYTPKKLVGSAGSFETLLEIFKKTRPIKELATNILPIESFYNSYYKFLEFDRENRLKIPGMIELRVDMIVVATTLIDYCLKTYKISEIKVSYFALKEGVLAQFAKNEPFFT